MLSSDFLEHPVADVLFAERSWLKLARVENDGQSLLRTFSTLTQKHKTAPKAFLGEHHCFAFLPTAFGKRLFQRCSGESQARTAQSATGPLECDRHKVRPVAYQVLPPLFQVLPIGSKPDA